MSLVRCAASGNLWLITGVQREIPFTRITATYCRTRTRSLCTRTCVDELSVIIAERKVIIIYYNYLSRGTTMDCSEEVHSFSDEASTPIELKKGMSIFLDVSILKKILSDCNTELMC